MSYDPMWTVSFFFLVCIIGVEALVCRNGEQPCGSNDCFNPSLERCINETATVECFNSCNGTCYSSSQYCYNNANICDNKQSVCDIKQNFRDFFKLGITCYNPSQYTCSNNTLCSKRYTCGTQCLDYYSVCVGNQIISCGFYIANEELRYVNFCGPQKQCYIRTQKVCLNQATACERRTERLCGTDCYDPTLQICVNGIVQCQRSCNGTCYSSSQYCYNNTKICDNGLSVCYANYSPAFEEPRMTLLCYNPTYSICFDNKLCGRDDLCGTQCADFPSVCVNNQTVCELKLRDYQDPNKRINACGPQQQCYDERTAVCVNGTTVCEGLNAQLCGTHCFKPDRQICIDGTVQCLNSCNGICYSNSQYCYNNSIVCNNNELICDMKTYSDFLEFGGRSPIRTDPRGPTCYDPSLMKCYNNSLCFNAYVCGTQCLIDQYSFCVNDEAICYDLYQQIADPPLCGPQKRCYDNRTSICLSDGTLCPIGSQLCSGECYNPELGYCIINDSTTNTPVPVTNGD